jgi:hypothetical protein
MKKQCSQVGFGEENMDQVNRMKNHAFFIGPFGQIVSHLVKDSGIQGNKIYFTLPRVLYEYDISMGSVGASLPCSNVVVDCRPQWILPLVKDK